MRLKNKCCLFSAAGKWTEVFIWLRMDSEKQENAYSVERWTSIFRCTKNSCQGLKKPEWIQATPWPESGADRAAANRENPVLFLTPNQYNPNRIFQIGNGFGFFLIFLSQRYNPLDLASKVSMQGAEIPRNPCEIMIQQSSYRDILSLRNMVYLAQ